MENNPHVLACSTPCSYSPHWSWWPRWGSRYSFLRVDALGFPEIDSESVWALDCPDDLRDRRVDLDHLHDGDRSPSHPDRTIQNRTTSGGKCFKPLPLQVLIAPTFSGARRACAGPRFSCDAFSASWRTKIRLGRRSCSQRLIARALWSGGCRNRHRAQATHCLQFGSSGSSRGRCERQPCLRPAQREESDASLKQG